VEEVVELQETNLEKVELQVHQAAQAVVVKVQERKEMQ
tara:strand:+ start:289 stop:402 length:114 start_codon:yes stop_codon:yes gene_type:complete